MTSQNKYGHKITQQEYDARVTGIVKKLGESVINTKEGERLINQEELNASIDKRLGILVPPKTRTQIFEIQQKLRASNLLFLVKGFLTSPTDPLAYHAKKHIKALSQVLDDEDVMSFFEITPSQLEQLRGPKSFKQKTPQA